MARSRVDVNKSIKEKPMKKTTKKESKSRSVPSTAIAIAFTALIAICVAIYFKTGSPIQEQNLDKTPVEENRKATANNKRTEGNTDSKVLPRLDGVKVGHVQRRQLSPGKIHEIKTLSLRPPIFEIPNFLTDDECHMIINLASGVGLDTSEVQDPETGINIEPTNEETFRSWDYNHDGVIDKVEVMHNLIDLSDLYFSEEDVHKMFSELKVDKNNNGVMDMSEFLTVETDRIMNSFHNMAKTLPRVKSRNSRQTWLDHRKIKGLNNRYITVLYFLNDVEEGGETAFPVANNESFSTEAWAEITKYRCDLSRHCHKANLYVKPRKGTAIMWYNHLRDKRTGWHGSLDEMTYHGGCDIIKGQKWIANNWINILGDSRDTMVSYKNPRKKIK
ncbi:PREDICTED: transmembrane prolyl 4-hydroxylase-like [Acropora digitifera]|uniref:transmembrane prolyl 4-hydroxylase-like n=1 Tax=Acropora digitifera TaxID=70779 RepID=UPI00077AD77D|nr:PREDICTED: transmembrane prolyl 4-hydroxylase-like [Acropora digitifera]